MRRIARLLRTEASPCSQVYVSNPTWGNHHNIFGDAGVVVEKYRCAGFRAGRTRESVRGMGVADMVSTCGGGLDLRCSVARCSTPNLRLRVQVFGSRARPRTRPRA